MRSKVESMSIELEEAKVKVAKFQKECEEYLVVIVQQKRDADDQQKVSFILVLNDPRFTHKDEQRRSPRVTCIFLIAIFIF